MDKIGIVLCMHSTLMRDYKEGAWEWEPMEFLDKIGQTQERDLQQAA